MFDGIPDRFHFLRRHAALETAAICVAVIDGMKRMRRDQVIGYTGGVMPMARPGEFKGMIAEPGAHRIELDISLTDEKIPVRIDN